MKDSSVFFRFQGRRGGTFCNTTLVFFLKKEENNCKEWKEKAQHWENLSWMLSPCCDGFLFARSMCMCLKILTSVPPAFSVTIFGASPGDFLSKDAVMLWCWGGPIEISTMGFGSPPFSIPGDSKPTWRTVNPAISPILLHMYTQHMFLSSLPLGKGREHNILLAAGSCRP